MSSKQPDPGLPKPSKRKWLISIATLSVVSIGGAIGWNAYQTHKEENARLLEERLSRIQSISRDLTADAKDLEQPREAVAGWQSWYAQRWDEDESLKRWFEFMAPYVRKVAARKVEGWETLMAETTMLPTQISELPNPDETIQNLASRREWWQSYLPQSAYIPADDLIEWVATNLPLSEFVWGQVEGFSDPNGFEKLEVRLLEDMEERLDRSQSLSVADERLAEALNEVSSITPWHRFHDQPRLERTLIRFEERMEEETGAAEQVRVAELNETLQQAVVPARLPVSAYRREGQFVVFGSGNAQGVRLEESGKEIIPPRYEILQVMGPVIVGRDPSQKRILVWNQLGQKIVSTKAGVDITLGADYDGVYVYRDEGVKQRKFLYVPERGCLIRIPAVETLKVGRGEDGVLPTLYLITDGEGMPLSEGRAFWRFRS